MSTIGSVGGSLSSYIQQWQQNLFNKIDANGDGEITKSELEQAVTSAGGTTALADALYADLDPNDTGSVSEQQFEQNLPMPSFSPEMGSQLIAAQEQNSGTATSGDPATQFANTLFSQLTNGGDTLTKSELEQAVTSAGGTTASADALYAKLDPNNTGSVSEQQFAANLPQPGDPSTGSETSANDSGNSATDAMAALMQSFAPPPFGGPMMGQATESTLAASGNATASAGSNSAQAALLSLLQTSAGSSTTTTTSANSAQDALYDLLQADGGTGATTTTGEASNDSAASTETSLSSIVGNINQQILAMLVQMQEQNLSG